MIGFHVAPRAAALSILNEGILASGPNPRWEKYGLAVQPAGVYVWTTFARALTYAADFRQLMRDSELGACDLWAVDLDGLDVREDPILGKQGARYVPHSLAPERLSLAVRP